MTAPTKVMDDGHRVIADLHNSLAAVIAMGGDGGNRPGHMPGCQQGIWTSAAVIPDGAPCSKRCQAARDAIAKADAWLNAREQLRENAQMALMPADQEVPE